MANIAGGEDRREGGGNLFSSSAGERGHRFPSTGASHMVLLGETNGTGTIETMRDTYTALLARYRAARERRKRSGIERELDRIDAALTQLRTEAEAVEHAAAWGVLDDDRETQAEGAADAAQGAALRRSIEHLEARRLELQLEL